MCSLSLRLNASTGSQRKPLGLIAHIQLWHSEVYTVHMI